MFRKISLMLSACIITVALAACATTGSTGSGTKQNLTPQQVVAITCPPLETALTQLEGIYATQAALGSASAVKAQAGIAKAQPIVAEVCSVGAAVSITSVQDFANTVLPALAQVAGTLPLTPKQLSDVQTALLTAQVALGVYDVVQSQMAVPAPASSVAH